MTRSTLHHQFQKALIEHCKLHEHLYPELALLFAIPNGELRAKSVAARLKAEGVKSGVPDLFLPHARYDITACEEKSRHRMYISHGLYIEIKADPRDKLSDAQKWWKEQLEAQGFDYHVARDMQETLAYIVGYLGGEL